MRTVLGLLILSSCASFSTSVMPLGDGRNVVRVQGNGYTTMDEVTARLHQVAEELCVGDYTLDDASLDEEERKSSWGRAFGKGEDSSREPVATATVRCEEYRSRQDPESEELPEEVAEEPMK
jgi:hypothetical protein